MRNLRFFSPLLLLSLACDVPPDPTPATTTGDIDERVMPTTGYGGCAGLPCDFDPAGLHLCPGGLECVPHPSTGLLACVAPCSVDGCPGPAIDCNGEPAKGECLPDADGVPSCFVIE